MAKNLRIYGLMLMVMSSIGAGAQVMITGTVMAVDKQPLIGASILVKGTSTGTTVDVEGAFRLQLEDSQKNATLVFSFIGFVSQEIAISGRSVIDVILVEDATQLNEVVVTGYTVQ